MHDVTTSSKLRGFMENLKYDFTASIVVFLVALPLSMGIAIASGVPEDKAAAVGIATAILGGLLVGALSGCPLQVSGPAAGLAVFVGQIIAQHGFAALGMVVTIAGLVQLAAGAFRLGPWFRAVSPAVIQGMLAGIGVLIFASQFHVMVDDQPPGTGKAFGGLVNLATIPGAVWRGVTQEAHQAAAAIGLLMIVSIAIWPRIAPRKLAWLPAALFGVLVTASVATVFQFQVKYIEVPDNLLEALSWPSAGAWLSLVSWPILGAGLALAFIASAESLLTATAADAMQQHAPRTKYDREIIAQGVGNLVCGLLGLLPMTGVIVRTSANIQSGARTRLSSMLHGVWLLLFAFLLPNILRKIPVSALAAILVYTGCKLINPKSVRELARYGKGEVAIYAATLVTVVFVDLLSGILVGIGLAAGQLLYRFSHLTIRVEDQPERNRRVLYLEGAATFIRLPKLAAALQEAPPGTELHVHMEELTYVDHACLDLLMNCQKQLAARGGNLIIDWESLTLKFRQEAANGKNGNSTTAKPSVSPPVEAAVRQAG